MKMKTEAKDSMKLSKLEDGDVPSSRSKAKVELNLTLFAKSSIPSKT